MAGPPKAQGSGHAWRRAVAALVLGGAAAAAWAQAPKPAAVTFGKAEAEACVPTERAVTVLAVGDVLLHETVQQWAARQPEGLLPAFEDVRALVQAADVAVANLEGPAALGVAPGGRAMKTPPAGRFDKVAYSGYPMFNYHPAVVTELARTGFQVLQTANNHALDRGSLGADLTLQAIDAAGLRRTGTRASGQTDAPWHTTVEVRRGAARHTLAFVACSYGTNGMPDPGRQVLLCHDQKDELLAVVRGLHARSDVHAVIVLPHWGQEYQSRPDARQQALARELADAGATAIIGTHPHVVQPLERLQAADGREVAVAWSLGNFISHQVGVERLSSMLLALALVPGPGPEGRLQPRALGWVPIRTRTSPAFSVLRLEGATDPDSRLALAHLRRTLAEENLHPGQPPFWAHRACRP